MLFIENKNRQQKRKKRKEKKVAIPAIADLTLCALVGIHLCTFIVLHGYFSLSKTSGPTMKVAGSEVLL